VNNFKNEPEHRPVDDYKGIDAKPVYGNKTQSDGEAIKQLFQNTRAGDRHLKKSTKETRLEQTLQRNVDMQSEQPIQQHVHEQVQQPVQQHVHEQVQQPVPPMQQQVQQPVQQQAQQPVRDTGPKLAHPFTEIKEMDLLKAFNSKESILASSVILPAGTHQLISDFVTRYTELAGKAAKDRPIQSEDATMINNVRATDELGMREDTLCDNKGVNSIKYEGAELTGKKIAIDVSNTEVSGQLAVSVFNSIVNQSNIFSHSLPSSGFSMSLVDIPEVDIAKLANLLNRATIRKSRDTRGNLHSNYGMLVMKEVLDFVSGYIYSTSIDVDNYKLSNYIRITDMPIILLLLMEYIHQKGFEVITSCANSLVYENDKPKCNANITAKVDLTKLLLVDPDKLDTWARKHLSKTSTSAHSVEDVTRYQDTLPSNANKIYNITSGHNKFYIELRNPTMTEAFEAMDQWEEMVRSGTDDITIGKDDEEIAELLNIQSLKTVLGMYLHFIVSISDDNGTYVKDRDSILNVLVSFNSNREVVAEIVKVVKEYIGHATIGHVGYAPYVCSQCGHHNGGSDIIELDMPSLGFNLVDLATSKMISHPHIF